MKVTRETSKPVFDPVVITLETQGEVDALYTLFNIGHIGDAVEQRCYNHWEKLKPFASENANRLYRNVRSLLNR